MSNRFASFGLPQTPAPLPRYGGRVPATRELGLSPVAGDLFVVEGAGPVYALPPAPRGTLITLLTTTALTLVNSSKLVLPGAANIVTSPNDALLMTPIADGAWQCLAVLPNAGFRRRLTADLTLYVNGSTGSDSNDGLSAATPFATIQKAIDVVSGTLDTSIYTVTIQVAAGTYTAALICKQLIGSGSVQLFGDATTPANVTISVTNGHCLATDGIRGYKIKGFKLTTSGSGDCIRSIGGGKIEINGNMNYGACAGAHMFAGSKGVITNLANSYTVSGAPNIHWQVGQDGLLAVEALTITLTASITVTNWAYAQDLSEIVCDGITFSLGGNTVTGVRYGAADLSIINTGGGGASYLPGSSAGSSSGGSIYK